MIDAELLQQAVETTEHGVYVTDGKGVILYANEGFARITGYPVDELVGSRMSVLSSGLTPASYYRSLWQTISSGQRWREEITNRRKNGTTYEAFQIITPVPGEDGKIRAYVGIQHDISQEKRIRRNLEEAVIECDAVFSNTLDALFLLEVVNGGESFAYVRLSKSHEQLTGLSTDAVRTKSPVEVFGQEQGLEIEGHLRECLQVGHPISYETSLNTPMGERIWHTQVAPVYHGTVVAYLVGAARDITDRKRMEEDLRYLSEIDTLTGIPNRRKTTEELDREIARAQRHGNALSVLMVDIDHFKSVNDELGHESGDTALRGVAATIQASLRPTDRVGRWGGEEFVVVLPETDHPGARTAAERIRASVEASRTLPDRGITVSIGVASLGPVRTANPRALGHTVDSLVRIADEELYRAKESGRNRISG